MKNKSLAFGKTAVYFNIFGILFSGLVFPLLTAIICPQPLWQGPELFIRSFHHLQTMTFFCGFPLVLGSLLTFTALYSLNSSREQNIWALSALTVNTLFSAVVFLNYIIQTTYIPYLATNNPPESASVLAVFSMSNPGSFAWALEMYGWGGIGLSFLLMAPVFGSAKNERVLKRLFIINGVCSFVSAIMTSVDMSWLFSKAGFASLIIWNLLVLSIDIFLLKYFRKLIPQDF